MAVLMDLVAGDVREILLAIGVDDWAGYAIQAASALQRLGRLNEWRGVSPPDVSRAA